MKTRNQGGEILAFVPVTQGKMLSSGTTNYSVKFEFKTRNKLELLGGDTLGANSNIVFWVNYTKTT